MVIVVPIFTSSELTVELFLSVDEGLVTVTVQVAVLLFTVVAVIVAVPSATAVTLPLEETVATEVLFDFHVTVLSVAFEGATVAVSVDVPPTSRLSDVLLSVTPVGLTVEDVENGRIGVHIVRERSAGSYTGHVVIRRANNKNNFTI